MVMPGQEGMLILWGFVRLKRSPSFWSTITSTACWSFWYVFWKPLGSTSISAKQMANLQKSKYLMQKKQKCAKKSRKLYIMKSSWPSEFKFVKFFKPKCVFKKNWKCANSLTRDLCKYLCEISLQKVSNLLAFVKGFPKCYKCRNQWLEVGLNIELVWYR